MIQSRSLAGNAGVIGWGRLGRWPVCDDESLQVDKIEISSINPNAHRVPGGAWNEEELPILSWEAPEHRIVLPSDLQRLCDFDGPVLRWAKSKYQRVVEQHSQPIELLVFRDPSSHISGWLRAGPEPGRAERWRVFFQVEHRWFVAVIGRDRNGSQNIVTIHSPSDRNYLPNMMAKGTYRVRGERLGED